jgi:hypothetical protein
MFIRMSTLCIGMMLLGIAAYQQLKGPKKISIQISDTREFLPNSDNPITITISNQTSAQIKVVGFGPTCGNNCCVRHDLKMPIHVGPNKTVSVVVPCHVHNEGSYNVKTTIFYEQDRKLKSYEIIISGNSISGRETQPQSEQHKQLLSR